MAGKVLIRSTWPKDKKLKQKNRTYILADSIFWQPLVRELRTFKFEFYEFKILNKIKFL